MAALKKVLILRFSSIGDIVLTTPVIRALKLQLDDVEIHYATKSSFKSILEENPYISKIHLLEDSLKDLITSLKAENFDYVIDLHHNLRTLRVKRALGKPSSSFNKLNKEKWLMVNLKINHLPNVHIVDRYMETLAPLGVKPDKQGLDYFIPEKDIVETQWLPKTHQKEYVAVAIGAGHPTKQLPLERLIELCDRINKPIILLGDKSDSELAGKIEAFFERKEGSAYEEGLTKLNKKSIIFNACGKLNLNQSASIIKKATHVFSHDSGLMHIAAAFKKNVFSIWGNTIPGFGMYPYRTKFTILENNNIGCRPCSKIGFSKCPKGHFKCMKEIDFDFYIP